MDFDWMLTADGDLQSLLAADDNEDVTGILAALDKHHTTVNNPSIDLLPKPHADAMRLPHSPDSPSPTTGTSNTSAEDFPINDIPTSPLLDVIDSLWELPDATAPSNPKHTTLPPPTAHLIPLANVHAPTDPAPARTKPLQPCGPGMKRSGSHSSLEKQRRDRFNTLLEELGELVPSGQEKYTDPASAVRRPKHVVLTDAINLLTSLRQRLKEGHEKLLQLQQQQGAVKTEEAAAPAAAPAAAAAAAPCCPPQLHMLRSSSGQVGLYLLPAQLLAAMQALQQRQQAAMQLPPAAPLIKQEEQQQQQQQQPPPELPPLPPPSAKVGTGVVVERQQSGMIIKISCRSRRGLLADIVAALGALPLRVVAATMAADAEAGGAARAEVVVSELVGSVSEAAVAEEDVQLALLRVLRAGRAAGCCCGGGKRARDGDSDDDDAGGGGVSKRGCGGIGMLML